MRIIRDIEQGTPEWHALRNGKLTASNASKIITAGGNLSTQRKDYLDELISDCFCPGQNAWKGNAATDRGKRLEPGARDHFRRTRGNVVEEVAFIEISDALGCSPDGLIWGGVDYVAGLEIKCPLPKTHLRYLIDGILPDAYKPQVHFSMAVTGFPWHFYSYCPGMKPIHLYIEPDSYTAKLKAAVDDFLGEYAKTWELAKQFREDLPNSSSDEI